MLVCEYVPLLPRQVSCHQPLARQGTWKNPKQKHVTYTDSKGPLRWLRSAYQQPYATLTMLSKIPACQHITAFCFHPTLLHGLHISSMHTITAAAHVLKMDPGLVEAPSQTAEGACLWSECLKVSSLRTTQHPTECIASEAIYWSALYFGSDL